MPDFKMQMWPRRTAGIANFSDFLPLQYNLSEIHQTLRCMRIPRNQIITMVNFNHITILRMPIRIDHHTARSLFT